MQKKLRYGLINISCLIIFTIVFFVTLWSYYYIGNSKFIYIDWKFFIAFIGGTINTGIIYSLYDKFYK
jgi:hypothetical protein